jgi:hypothetical protein
MIFDDLYSVEIIEEKTSEGHEKYVANWTMIESQTPPD